MARNTAGAPHAGPGTTARGAADGAGTGAIIERARLHAQVAGRPVVAAIAGGGYGKSVLLRQLAAAVPGPTLLVEVERQLDAEGLLAALVRAARGSGLSDLAHGMTAGWAADTDTATAPLLAALGSGEGGCLVVDEVDRLDDSGAALLARICTSARPPSRVLLGGRLLPGPLAPAVVGADRALLTAADLAFTPDEVTELLQSSGRQELRRRADDILAATSGWPAAVAVAGTRSRADGTRSGPDPARVDTARPRADPRTSGSPSPTESATPLGPTLPRSESGRAGDARLPDPSAMPVTVAALACLPVFSAEIATAIIGADSLEVLAGLGIPVVTRPDGWLELADPIRERIGDPHALTPDQRERVARAYADGGRLPLAFALLAEHPDTAADLLARLPVGELELLGMPDLQLIVDGLGDDVLARHPQALATAIRLTERLPVNDARGRWIDRAVRVIPDDHPLRPFVLTESARMAIRTSDIDRAATLARAALAHPEVRDQHRGRAHHVLGLVSAHRGYAADLRAGSEELAQAIALLHRAGEARWESEARLALAFGIDYPLGAIPLAVDGLREAVALQSGNDAQRAELLTYLAEILTWVPDLAAADAALREAETIASRLRDTRLAAYVQWSWAWVESRRPDHTALRSRLDALQGMASGHWYSHAVGASLQAETAEMFAGLGDGTRAVEHLETAERMVAESGFTGVPLERARAVVLARFGDPVDTATELLEFAGSSETPPAHRWRYLLLAAWCAHRAGDDDAARERGAAALSEVAGTGYPAMADAIEPELTSWARGLLGRSTPYSSCEITVFGEFAVRRGRDLVTPPPGAPRVLIGCLVVQGPQPVERVIDMLWPDVALDVGRARLRNLLNRIRSASGDLVTRHDDRLSLQDGTTSDWARFEAVAANARRADPQRSAGTARQALGEIGGDLLPGFDQEWVETARAGVDRIRLDLLDRIAGDAERAGDLDEAVRGLDAALKIDPWDADLTLRMTGLLLRQGRRGAGRRSVRDALAALAEAGLPADRRLLALAQQLGAAAA